MAQMIKVLFVDDSPVALEIFRRMLAATPDVEVVGTARNGAEALELIPVLEPTIICTDLHMPVMDGLELTREVMRKYPRPILVISVSVQEGSKNVFDLLEAGAVDVFPKPRDSLASDLMGRGADLVKLLRILAGVRVFKRWGPKVAAPPSRPIFREVAFPGKAGPVRVVAIGASTGGPQAIQALLSQLPEAFPVPVICIQHIGEGFLNGLVEWLKSACRLKVMVAEDGQTPLPGSVYFGRENAHLVINGDGRFAYSYEPPYGNHRPSITLTFRSMAERFGGGALGVLLTGMGSDGAEGLKAIADAGGRTIAQDESTSVVWGMPKCAVELGAARQVLPLQEIAGEIVRKVQAKGMPATQ